MPNEPAEPLDWSKQDGTGKLLMALHPEDPDPERRVSEYLGGANAPMLHEAAELIVSQRAKLSALEEILRKLEWSGEVRKLPFSGPSPTCVCCSQAKYFGHNSWCELAKLLRPISEHREET